MTKSLIILIKLWIQTIVFQNLTIRQNEKFGEVAFEEMYFSGKWPFGDMPVRGNGQFGEMAIGEMIFGKMGFGEVAFGNMT